MASNYEQTSKFLATLENTGYLQLISKLLEGANKILEVLKVQKLNVLVHCSDGWDRTA